jgi:hypothetical protein
VRAQDASFNITLERVFDHGLAPMELAPQEMTRVFLNLFGNGFYAVNQRRVGGAETGFRPTIRVATRDTGEGVEIKVRDNGIGIPPRSGKNCSSLSSPPSRPAKAPGSDFRSATTSSHNSTAARSRSSEPGRPPIHRAPAAQPARRAK